MLLKGRRARHINLATLMGGVVEDVRKQEEKKADSLCLDRFSKFGSICYVNFVN